MKMVEVAAHDGRVYVDGRSVANPGAPPKQWVIGRAAPVGFATAKARGRRLVIDRGRQFERADVAVLVPDDEPLPGIPSWWWVDRSLDNAVVRRVTHSLGATSGVIWMPRGADCAKLSMQVGLRPWHIVPRDVLRLAQTS